MGEFFVNGEEWGSYCAAHGAQPPSPHEQDTGQDAGQDAEQDAERTFHVPAGPTGPRMARHNVRAAMTCWQQDQERTEAAELVVSELVTNAFQHGWGHGTVWCRLSHTAGEVCLRVWSRAGLSARVPEPRPDPEDLEALAESGRGLQIVDALSRSWGSSPTRSGAAGRLIWVLL